jgi:N-acetylmuramoyl-L-alanine amidase
MKTITSLAVAIATAGIFIFSNTNADTTGEIPIFESNTIAEQFIMDTAIDSYAQKDIDCMVQNIYHEARSEGYAGMYAVAMVVMNRVQDDRYPNTVCGVIKQGPVRESWKTKQTKDPNDGIYYPIKHKCQFSWYCDGKSDEMYETDSFFKALQIAELVLINSISGYHNGFYIVDITEGATHYHTVHVNPAWRHDRGMALTGRIGDHLFYRWN